MMALRHSRAVVLLARRHPYRLRMRRLDRQTDALCLMDADGSNFEILVDEPGVHENHFSWGVTPSP